MYMATGHVWIRPPANDWDDGWLEAYLRSTCYMCTCVFWWHSYDVRLKVEGDCTAWYLRITPSQQQQHGIFTVWEASWYTASHNSYPNVYLVSAPVSLGGRWGGGRSSLRWFLLEDKRLKCKGEKDQMKTGRTECGERAELISGNGGGGRGFSLQQMLQAKVTSCLTSCTERMVSKRGRAEPQTNTHPQFYSARMACINLPLTRETDWTQARIELCSLPATVGGCFLKPFLFISLLIKVFCGEGNCDQAGRQQPSLPLTLQRFWTTAALLCWRQSGGALWAQIVHSSESAPVCRFASAHVWSLRERAAAAVRRRTMCNMSRHPSHSQGWVGRSPDLRSSFSYSISCHLQ